MALDSVMPHLHLGADQPEGHSSSWKRTTLLVLAVTLHNIPEGMAVGFSFALAAQHGDDPACTRGPGPGAGNGPAKLPRRRAISLPLRQEGLPAWKSFVYGGLSGIVEPLFGILAVLAAGSIQSLLPGCWPLPPGPCCMWWWRSSSQRPIWESTPTLAPWGLWRAFW